MPGQRIGACVRDVQQIGFDDVDIRQHDVER
jgi:hypothetical protein